MKQHLDELLRQLGKLRRECDLGRAAKTAPKMSSSTLDRLRVVANQIDDFVPFVIESGITPSEADQIRQQLQEIPWSEYQKQVLTHEANRIISWIEEIRNGKGFDREQFRKFESLVQHHAIFDWRSIGITSRDRRILERLASSDINPYDSQGWLERLQKLEVETAGM